MWLVPKFIGKSKTGFVSRTPGQDLLLSALSMLHKLTIFEQNKAGPASTPKGVGTEVAAGSTCRCTRRHRRMVMVVLLVGVMVAEAVAAAAMIVLCGLYNTACYG